MKTNLLTLFILITLTLAGRADTPPTTRGKASWYAESQRTATGERFNPNGLTAAHRTLPFGTKVKITNLHNQRSVTVVINDRGPYRKGRIIDLSRGAAAQLQMLNAGIASVEICQIEPD